MLVPHYLGPEHHAFCLQFCFTLSLHQSNCGFGEKLLTSVRRLSIFGKKGSVEALLHRAGSLRILPLSSIR